MQRTWSARILSCAFLAVVACGGATTSSNGPNCGPGTHDAGGTCELDAALVLVESQSLSQYWNCSTSSCSQGPSGYHFQFVGASSTTSGTGTLQPMYNCYKAVPSASMTWTELSSSSLTVTSSTSSVELTQIQPNGFPATLFTALQTDGIGTQTVHCSLVGGAP